MYKQLLKFKTLLLVCLLTIVGTNASWAKEKTITLDYSSFGLTTSYAEKTATVDGIGFTVNQGYKGTGDVIQMNSSKGSGILYNTTAIAGLKSITVKVSSGSKTYTVTTGTSEKPTANSQTGTSTGTYNAASGDTYFQLKVSGASYFTSIVITYDDSNSGSNLSTSDLALTDASIALSFDLYNNSSAQTVSFTTSSTGTVTVSGGEDYCTTSVSGSTITVTPTAVTPSAQTITVSQAADDTYAAGTVTFSLNITDSTPIPTHTATFSVNGTTSTQDFEEGASITFPANPTDVNGKSFVGWVASAISGTTNTAPSFVTSATMGTSDVTYYAVFADVTPGTQTTKTDVFDLTTTGVSGTSYTSWTNKKVTSDAVYAGNNAGGNSVIQLRSSTSSNSTFHSGIVSTTSGGYISKVVVSWDSSTANERTLDVYGNNTAYTTADDLYSAYEATQGTKLGSIVKGTSTELSISGDYEYIGLRSYSGAMYLTSISIEWTTGTPATYSNYCTTVPDAVDVTGVTLDKNTATLEVGNTVTLTATVAPNNATNKNVTWESSDEDVATVEDGVVTAVGVGSATITVKSVADNTKTATCAVTVNPTAVTSVSVDATASVNVGETTTLTATVSPDNATNKNVTWASSNTDIATVDENGVVTGVAEGTATITVTSAADNTKTATCTVTVTLAAGTAAKPYTVAEAITVINALDDNGTLDEKYVSGKISQIDSYNSTYKSITYWISDDGTTTSQLEVYSGKGLNGADFSASTDLEVGDEVVVKGQLKKYVKNSTTTPEFSQSSQIVSRTQKPASDLTKTNDITLDYKNDDTMADLTDYFTTSSTGAITYTVADETVVECADELISALKIGTTTVTVSQAADASYRAGEITINVTVQDTREAVTTIPGINISTLKTGASDGTIEVVNPVKADEGVTFSFASSNEDVLLIAGTDYIVGAVGTTTVTVTATPSNANLYKPVVADFTVTVEAATKTDTEILLDEENGSTTFGTPIDVEYMITDGYDGTMTYSIDNSAIAEVAIGADAITFTPKAVGTAVITISAPATVNFNAAEDVTYTLTVTAPVGSTTAAVTSVTLFSETFDKCEGTGGRDDVFTGNVGTTATTDKLDEKWETIGSNGANKCIKLGTGSATGSVTTSNIALTGNGTLTFSAAGWGDTKTNTITITASGATLSGDTEVTLTNGEWKSYNVQISNGGNDVSITFSMQRGFLDDVVVKKAGVEITAKLNGSGYATFCSEYPLDFTDATDHSAWLITGVSNNTITFAKITGSIKGGQGILLKGTANETVTLASADSENTLSGNKLVGTLAPTYVAAEQYYGLSGANFVKVNAGTVKAGKALLPASALTSSGDIRAYTFVFVDPTTGITETQNVSAEEFGAIFNLAGQRISQPQKGVNIINGKKVLVK